MPADIPEQQANHQVPRTSSRRLDLPAQAIPRGLAQAIPGLFTWTIPGLLACRRRSDPDVRALVDDEGSITYRELDDASRGLACRLAAAGVIKGDRVGLLMPNGIGWATTALAVMRMGAVLVPLSTLLRPPELLAQLNTAAVTHLITVRSYRGRSYLDDLDATAPGIMACASSWGIDASVTGQRHAAVPSLRQVWPEDGLPSDAVSAALVQAMENLVRPADDMAILFTSGSRGTPKGVIHTHGNALRTTAAGLEARCISPGERLYIPMPFFWMGGFGGGLLSALVAGATLLTEATPGPERTIKLLERERATLFRGWPDQAARLAAHPAFATADLSSLGAGSLGAVLPEEQRPAPGARANLFGMTESFGPYCGDRLDTDLPPAKHGSCGRPFAGTEVRIADPDTGEQLPAGRQGEIWLRGPSLMRGICGRDRTALFTPDGFYRTGDLGRLDEDGYLWHSGRLDDMFKVRGATVYPSEVEAALRSILGVSQAFVTNVTGRDGSHQVGALVVVSNAIGIAPGSERARAGSRTAPDSRPPINGPPGTTRPTSNDDNQQADQLTPHPGTAADHASLAESARARLSSFKVPTVWLVVTDPEAVPMTPTGKVDKPRLQHLLRDV